MSETDGLEIVRGIIFKLKSDFVSFKSDRRVLVSLIINSLRR